jgi:hypothetical protein
MQSADAPFGARPVVGASRCLGPVDLHAAPALPSVVTGPARMARPVILASPGQSRLLDLLSVGRRAVQSEAVVVVVDPVAR